MDDAAKSQPRKVVVGVLLVLISLGVLVGAVFAMGGMELINQILAGDYGRTADSVVPPRPSIDATDTAGATPPPIEPTEGSDENALADLREWMYWEQVDSQDSIGELVAGKWRSFSVVGVNLNPTTASLTLAGMYKSGASLQGTLVLRKLESAWYFSKITSDGNVSLGPTGRRGADNGVVSTIVSEQGEATNQAVINGLRDGGYKTITVNSVKRGSGTATIDITLAGGTKGTRAGRIVCVSKTINGRKHWFITRCEER